MKNGNGNYIKWSVFTFIISLLIGVAVWFANMTNNKLDKISDQVSGLKTDVAVLEQRTKVLEKISGTSEANIIKQLTGGNIYDK